jgi:hypothetical protein
MAQIFVGFGVLLLCTVLGLLLISFVAPDVFRQLVKSLEELRKAVFPGIVYVLR